MSEILNPEKGEKVPRCMRTPHLIGKMGRESSNLKNTYMITEEGLLIPHPIYFFGDSFRALGGLSSLASSHAQGGISTATATGSLNEIVHDGMMCVDEILAICDPHKSWGIITTTLRGRYLPDSQEFLNSGLLCDLLTGLSENPYDIESRSLTDSYSRAQAAWTSARESYHSYFMELHEEQDCGLDDPVPRGLDDLAVILVTE